MFQYTHDVVINSKVTRTGKERFLGNATTGTLIIKEGGGEYRKGFIGGKKIYKTTAYDGTLGKLTIECDGLIENQGIHNLFVQVQLVEPLNLAEYAYPNWYAFGKPLLINFDVTSELKNDPEKLAKKIANLFKIAVPVDNRWIDIDVDGSKVILTGSFFGLQFKKENVGLEWYDPTGCDTCNGMFIEQEIPDANLTVVKTVLPFGTGEWMLQNHRLPTYPNLRYASPNVDEMPVAGAKYTQYSFIYDSPRPGFGGASGVGQVVEAATRHIYFVREDLVADFESAIETAFGDYVEIVPFESVNNPDDNAVPGEPANP